MAHLKPLKNGKQHECHAGDAQGSVVMCEASTISDSTLLPRHDSFSTVAGRLSRLDR